MENDAIQTSEVSKYQLISQRKLDKFQLQCYSKMQMFEVAATRFHAETQTFAPLISAADRSTRESVICYHATRVRCPIDLNK